MEDTRPFDHCIPTVVDEHDTPILGGHHPRPLIPLHHRKIIVPLFSQWCNDAIDRYNGIRGEELPAMFRFALQRPLMPESELQKTLEEFGIDPTLSFLSEMRIERAPEGRLRRQLYGLGPLAKPHVSNRYRDELPMGLSLLNRDVEDTGVQGLTTRQC